jgi:hypothetical protein
MLIAILTTVSLGLTPVMAQEAPARASDWHPFSRSSTTVYLADAGTLALVDGATRVQVARVPLSGSDFSYEVDTYAIRCGAREIRFMATSIYDEAGALSDSYEETLAEWEPMAEGTNYGFLYEVACNEKRSSQGSYPSVTAYIGQTR